MTNCVNIEKYSKTYSAERLLSFAYKESDTIEDIIVNYRNNILISQAIYPELCTLEIILRNSIDDMLRKYISGTWIEDEINNNILLDEYDYKTLLKTYNDAKADCLSASKNFTTGKVVANLNFGFWTNICGKKYNSQIWNKPKCFNGVFINYPNKKKSINEISKKLYMIRRFRNRVFHYEKIFKYPNRTLELYNIICEIISYLANDELELLNRTSIFFNTYNKLIKR